MVICSFSDHHILLKELPESLTYGLGGPASCLDAGTLHPCPNDLMAAFGLQELYVVVFGKGTFRGGI